MAEKHSPYHHGDLRRALITTALTLLAEKGLESVTMRELSEDIGVSRMAAYRHFKNKNELLCAVAEKGFREIAEINQRILAQAGPDAMDTLEAIGRAYVGFALAHPALYRLMYGPTLTRTERPDSMRETAHDAFAPLVATVEKCQARGSIRPGSGMAIAGFLWSSMHGIASLLIEGQLITAGEEDSLPVFLTDGGGAMPKEAGKVLDLAVAVILKGLAPHPAQN